MKISPSLFLLAGAVFVVPSLSFAAAAPTITWRQSTPTPEPRAGYASGTIDGKLFLIGGTYWEGTQGDWTKKVFSAAVHEFDPIAQTWEQLNDAPVKLGYPGVAQVDGEIFVMGGVQDGAPGREVLGLRKVGSGYAWVRSHALPENRVFGAAVALGRTIYFIGGTHAFEPFDAKGTCCTSKTDTRTVWSFDTARPSAGWKTLAEFPGAARWGHHAATDGKAIYLFGGHHQALQTDPVQSFNEVLHYDPESGLWSRVGTMPEAMQGAATVTVGGKIILVAANKQAMSFDPATGVFTPVAGLPEDASLDGIYQIGTKLVGASGENRIDSPRRRSPWTFIGDLGR